MTMTQASYGLHWFRRDLRIAGNPALKWNWQRHQGRVLGVFCFDKVFLSRSDFSHARFQFFLQTLAALKQELQACGSDLIFMDVGPDEGFTELFARLSAAGQPLPSSIAWNRDYEPFARQRDQRMQSFFQAKGLEVHTERDHLIIEPHEIIKESQPDSPYQVYSPFQKSWLKVFQKPEVQDRILQQKKGLKHLDAAVKGKLEKIFDLTWSDRLPKSFVQQQTELLQSYHDKNGQRVAIPIPDAGSTAAYHALQSFRPKVDDYGEQRDIPSVAGTSRLSIFFKNGSLTPAQVIAAMQLGPEDTKDTGRGKFLAELIWREFYYYILSKFPRVENEAFLERYQNLKWQNREDHFEAWKDGRTGFPIVDAGMRELKQTGWMHNRVRMIVASFLTKDLLIDWKWGERYFMETLLDGDLAPNNGGWQWAASTGCDPQPYFRIFNPLLQSQKFDPDGIYIKRFIPEMAQAKGKDVHQPSLLARSKGYPAPIVDHAKQRDRALALYKSAT